MATLSRFPDMVANSREANWAPPETSVDAPRALRSVLPLGLAGPFYDTSTLVAVSQTTKECAASRMLAAQWGGVFTRRFPCLAAQPAFQAPLADARGVVRSLLAATPPSLARVSNVPTPAPPPAPRDAEGRALPLREDVIIAAQLAVRGDTALSHRPLLKGALRIQDVEDLTGNSDSDYWNGVAGPNWLLEIPLETVARTWDEHRDVMRQTLQLPDQIELDLENGTTVPADLATLMEATCRLVDARLRQEIYIVAGDQVWRLDTLRACSERDNLNLSLDGLNRYFYQPYADQRASGGSFIGFSPSVPLECHFENINCAMATYWRMGCYDYLGFDGDEYEEGRSPADPLVYTTETIKYDAMTLEWTAWWGRCVERNYVSAHTGSYTDNDDGHFYLSQLLASTRPVRIARAVRA